MDASYEETRRHTTKIRALFENGMQRNEIKKTLFSLICVNCTEQNKKQIEYLAKNFSSQFRKKWLAVKRTKSSFLKKFQKWLNNDVIFLCVDNKNKNYGRPKQEFSNLSYTSKYKRTKDLRKRDTNELLYASEISLRTQGKQEEAKILSSLMNSGERNLKSKNITKQLSTERALALIIDTRLSKRQYQDIRNTAKEQNVDLYPSYNKIREAKALCYPEKIHANEHSVYVELQSLLDHTSSRLLSTLELQKLELKSRKLFLLSKWGMDGSSGQKEYRQAFRENFSDSNLLLTCLVPLQLYLKNRKGEKIIIWNNPTPSSTKYCRPCKIQFLKETIQISKIETDSMKSEIAKLNPTIYVADQDLGFEITHQLQMTMLDNKMINSLTDTSSQKCYLCGASSVDMNNIDKVLQRPINHEYLQFGITSLHLWIRSFECLLKVSYRLPLKKWQARGDDKLIIKEQKLKIQSEFKTRLGIIVDQPKQGAGTSNDGNCARNFFRNFTISAEITKLNVDLIYRFYVILQVIASNMNINVEIFQKYSLETARQFVSLYPWYRMPASIHKMLLHGSQIIKFSPVPIGQLSEEAQEARNKEYRRYREHNSRKCSRTATNIDVFNNLLVSSDPNITYLRKKLLVKKKISVQRL